MDAVHATSLAECLEQDLGARSSRARVECYAVPRRPGSTRRKTPWSFLVVTDLEEHVVREALAPMPVEVVERRGRLRVFTAWPQGPLDQDL